MTETNTKEGAIMRLKNLLAEDIRASVTEGLTDVTNAQKQFEKTFEENLERYGVRIEKLEKGARKHDLPGAEEETHEGKRYDFGRVALGLATGEYDRYCPMEYEMSREMFAQGTVPDTKGGFLVPNQVTNDQIIPLLRPKLIIAALGINEMQMTGGPVEIPRETVGPVVDAVAENEANTSSDLEFGMHRLEPRVAQSYVKASRSFLMRGVGADGFIRRRMAEEIAQTLNTWALKGTGADGQPIGVLNTAGVNEIDFTGAISGASVTSSFYQHLLAMEFALEEANALDDTGNMGWALAPRVKLAARQVKSDADSAAHLEFDRKVITEGADRMLLGHPYQCSTILTSGTDTQAIFGNWDHATLALWNNLSLEASNVAGDAFPKRQTHIIAYTEADVAVTQPSAFSVATLLDTSGLVVS